jgi:hypothetical protein
MTICKPSALVVAIVSGTGYSMGIGGRSAPLGSPEAATDMQDQILALIAQFAAEAEQVAAELRSFLPLSDPGRRLELLRRHEELRRWISTCEADLA